MKPDEILREKLNKRTIKTMIQSGKPVGRLTDEQKKTPSEKRSDNFRKSKNSRRSNQ